jgi:hypothetical protein
LFRFSLAKLFSCQCANVKADFITVSVCRAKNKGHYQAEHQVPSPRRAAVLDWSFFPVVTDAIQDAVGQNKRLMKVTLDADPLSIDLRDRSTCPWVFLRGVCDESQSLVLGNSDWRLDSFAESRRKILQRLRSTGSENPVAIFVGCRGEALGTLYEELQSAFQNQLRVVVLGSDITKDDRAASLAAQGLDTITVDPETFLNYIQHDFPEPAFKVANSDRFVLDIAGVEYAESE